MSGRRAYQRFRELAPLDGELRITRDVAVQVDESSTEIVVLSDTPGVLGEELTLALVSSAGQMEFLVKVAESRPQIVQGVMHHRVRFDIITPGPDISESRSE